MKNKLMPIFLLVIVLLLASCQSHLSDKNKISSSPSENLFEVTETTSASDDQELCLMEGGFKTKSINIPENRQVSFSGKPVELSYTFESKVNATIGVMLLIEGFPQPHRITVSSDSSLSPISTEDQLVSYHKIRLGQGSEFTLSFTPVIGKAGDNLKVEFLKFWQADCKPKEENESYGFYQYGSLYLPVQVQMEQDGLGTIDDLRITPEYVKKSENFIDSQPTNASLRLYFNNSKTLNSVVNVTDNKLKFDMVIESPHDSDFRLVFFANYGVLPIDSHQSIIVHAKGRMLTAASLEIDVSKLPRSNSFFATMLPLHRGKAQSEVDLYKYFTIHLINELASPSENNESNIQAGPTVVTASTPTSQAVIEDKDLSDFFTKNSIKDLGIKDVGLSANKELLVWTDDGGVFKFDTVTGKLLNQSLPIKESELERIAFHFLDDGFAVFRAPQIANSERVFAASLEIYGEDLTLERSQELNGFFEGRSPFDPTTCAISKDGKQAACPTSDQIIELIDTINGVVTATCQINSSGNEIRQINSLKFIENTSLLAFTLQDISSSAYGLIDLASKELKLYQHWQIVDSFIQQAGNTVYFREGYIKPEIPFEGKVIAIDLTDFSVHAMKFENEEALYFVASEDGKLLITRTYAPGSTLLESKTIIRVYETDSKEIVRSIEVPYSLPSIIYDPEMKILYVANYDGKRNFLRQYNLN